MDDLSANEIEGIWQRSKKYFDTKDIKNPDEKNIEKVLSDASAPREKGRNPQSNFKFLIRAGFAKKASENEKIKREILEGSVREVKAKGKTRFQIAKGFKSQKSKSGRVFKAGQFLPGANKNQAIEKFSESI